VGGYEVLARIPDGDGGFLPTEEAIAMAEAAGAIADLDRAVLTAAITAASILHAQGGPSAFVACNLSGRTLSDPDLHDRVAALLDEHGLPPSALWLECTERIAAELDERSLAQLAALRDLGVEIAMDDFGTGHSSLHRFRSLPFTVLKLARSFVSPLPGTPQDRAIVAAILHLAAAFGVDVVAEGVETDEQASFLAATGVRWTQGYLYGKPLSVLDLVGSAPLTAPPRRGPTSR
jgi:EAL domain-containing protein (putative c-di-GMP-specific phosphodiesterase class I)